jgi:hypothetical protein
MRARRPGGWDEDQCWTLARITEVVRRWFGVEYTLAGMDLLLHRIGWSVPVPARRAAERDEAAIAAWREEAWPGVKGRRRLDRLRGRVWPGLKAAERPHLGTGGGRWPSLRGALCSSCWAPAQRQEPGSSAAGSAGLRLGRAAIGLELPVLGVVAGAFGLELAGGAHDLSAERPQLRGDGLVCELPVWTKRVP